MERNLGYGINRLVIHVYNDNGTDYGKFQASSMLKDNTVSNDILVPSNTLIKLDDLDNIKLGNSNDNDNSIVKLKNYQKLLRLNSENYKELQAINTEREYKNDPNAKELDKLKNQLEELTLKRDNTGEEEEKNTLNERIKQIEKKLKEINESIRKKANNKNIQENLKKNITLILNGIFKDNRNITLPNNAGDNEIVKSKYSFGLAKFELEKKNKVISDKLHDNRYDNIYNERERFERQRFEREQRYLYGSNSKSYYQTRLENENKVISKDIYWDSEKFIKYVKKYKDQNQDEGVEQDQELYQKSIFSAEEVSGDVLERGGKTIHIIVTLKLKKGRTDVVNKFLGPLAKCKIKRQSLKEQLKYHLESFEEYIKPKTKKRTKRGGYKTKKRKYYYK